jgi:hypothetical protein
MQTSIKYVQIIPGEFLCHETSSPTYVTYVVRIPAQNLNNARHGKILLVGPDTDNLRWSSASSRQDPASSPISLGLAETRIRFTCQLNTAKQRTLSPKDDIFVSDPEFN